MEIVALTAAFLLSASAAFGEYIYVDDHRTWVSAQTYCRDKYVDLTPVASLQKAQRFLGRQIQFHGELWTGLYREGNQWKWSGGSEARKVPWATGQPDSASEDCGSIRWWPYLSDFTGLHNVQCGERLPFLCVNLIVPQYRGTWEEALAYCSKNHSGLTSLTSTTQHLHALSKVRKGLSERVWIGLRFLGDRWMWIDGRNLAFQAWNREDQEHRCPVLNRCGTLTQGGVWESWDCTDRLHFLCR